MCVCVCIICWMNSKRIQPWPIAIVVKTAGFPVSLCFAGENKCPWLLCRSDSWQSWVGAREEVSADVQT